MWQEASKGDTINDGIMKQLTGGDVLTGRHLFKDPISFIPQFTLCLCLNVMPTINSNDGNIRSQSELNIGRSYPFRVMESTLPSDNTGFIYILVSRSNRRFTYIGQTINLNQRFRDHNTGHGAIGTANPEDRPFAVAAYISGLGKYSKQERMSLEEQWKYYRDQLPTDDPFEIINQGLRVVQDQNVNAETIGCPDRINFVSLVEPRN